MFRSRVVVGNRGLMTIGVVGRAVVVIHFRPSGRPSRPTSSRERRVVTTGKCNGRIKVKRSSLHELGLGSTDSSGRVPGYCTSGL